MSALRGGRHLGLPLPLPTMFPEWALGPTVALRVGSSDAGYSVTSKKNGSIEVGTWVVLSTASRVWVVKLEFR